MADFLKSDFIWCFGLPLSSTAYQWFFMKVPVKALLILSIVSFIFYFPARSFAAEEREEEEKKNQMEQIKLDLDREKEKYLKFDLKEKSILDQLSIIEKDITEKRNILRQLAEKIRNSKKELEKHRTKLDQLETSLMHMEVLLEKRLVSFYKNAKRGYLKILATTDDLDKLNHNMKYLREIMNEDRAVMKRIFEDQSNYRMEASIVEEQLEAIADLEKSEEKRLVSLKQDLEIKVLLLAKIHEEKELYEIAVKELESAARNLRNTIYHVDHEEPAGKESLPSGFRKAKGKLPMPLKGKILRKTKKAGGESFAVREGIHIEGEFGSPVRAVFPGRVDFSGTLKGYGQVIVINHGERYFTISAYLLERNINEGDTVTTGDVIGLVGESGLVAGSALYFEIRKGEDNLDPAKWIKVN